MKTIELLKCLSTNAHFNRTALQYFISEYYYTTRETNAKYHRNSTEASTRVSIASPINNPSPSFHANDHRFAVSVLDRRLKRTEGG